MPAGGVDLLTSIALARNIQVPAFILWELVKPALQELQIVSGFRNLKPPTERISSQIKTLKKKKKRDVRSLGNTTLTCHAVTNTSIEGRISGVGEANSSRALQIQHVGL